VKRERCVDSSLVHAMLEEDVVPEGSSKLVTGLGEELDAGGTSEEGGWRGRKEGQEVEGEGGA
jgi:hypothetical protein